MQPIYMLSISFVLIIKIETLETPLWKLNPRDRTMTLTKLLIKHAKLTPKETEIGA